MTPARSEALDAIAHGALGDVTDATRHLGRRDAAIFGKKRDDLSIDRVETECHP